MNQPLKVGDILYDYSLKEYPIISVGRVYYTVKWNYRDAKVRKENINLVSERGEIPLYSERQVVVDMKEKQSLLLFLYDKFKTSSNINYTLPQLRQLKEMIESFDKTPQK